MPLIPIAILAWFKNNIKWVVIGLAVAAISFGAWRYTKLVENYAKAEQQIVLLNQNIKDKEKALQFERDKAALSEQAIEDLTKQNDQLEADLDKIAENLPDDANQLAPESIREILKRLQGLTND